MPILGDWALRKSQRELDKFEGSMVEISLLNNKQFNTTSRLSNQINT